MLDERLADLASIQPAKLERQRVRLDYRDINNKRIIRVFDSDVARDAYLEFEARMGRIKGSTPPTLLRDLVTRFKDDRLAVTTRARKYECSLVTNYIAPYFDGKYLPEVGGRELGAMLDLSESQVSRATRKAIETALGKLLDYAISHRELNPGDDPRPHIPRPANRLSRAIRSRIKQLRRLPMPSLMQLRKMLEHSAGWVRVAVHLAILAGLRGQEIRALQWKHVLWKTSQIHVVSAIKIETGAPGATKSGADRFVDIEPELLEVLRQFYPGPGHEEDLVVQKDGAGVNWYDLWKGVHDLQVELGFGRRKRGANHVSYEGTFGPHMLRHAAVAYWIWQGKRTDVEIQIQIGHANLVITFDVYGYLIEAYEQGDASWPAGLHVPTSIGTDEQIMLECAN